LFPVRVPEHVQFSILLSCYSVWHALLAMYARNAFMFQKQSCTNEYICSSIYLPFVNRRRPGARKSMFFDLFAAAKPSANVCVAHGTLCNDPSVNIATTT